MKQTHKNTSGFSLVELLVVIVVIALLASIVVFSPIGFLESSRDKERVDDIKSIARRLEQSYTEQALGRPAYPSTQEFSTDAANRSRTLVRLSAEALHAPGGSTGNNIVVATSNSTTTPVGSGPTQQQYAYQPLRADGSLCNSADSSSNWCVKFNLYYRLESGATTTLYKVKSMNQQ